MPIPDDSGNPLPITTTAKRRRRPRVRVSGPVSSVPPVPFSAPTPLPPVPLAPSIGAQFVELFTANKWLRWSVFWFGWFWISPGTIIPGGVAVLVGLVFYKERAFNLVTICAAYLGILAYLALGHTLIALPEQVRLYMGLGGIFALIVLGKRYPMFGFFMIVMICSAFSRGRGRRW